MKPISEWTDEKLWDDLATPFRAIRDACVSELLRREREAIIEACAKVCEELEQLPFFIAMYNIEGEVPTRDAVEQSRSLALSDAAARIRGIK